ncbi:MAG: VOC family protein [Actinomycetes bacterium]
MEINRLGTILAVKDVNAAVDFYTSNFNFRIEATYENPGYATLTFGALRLSLAEQGHPADDLKSVSMQATTQPNLPNVMLVFEVPDCDVAWQNLMSSGVNFASEIYRPSWGGARFFIFDLDDYLIEIEQMA